MDKESCELVNTKIHNTHKAIQTMLGKIPQNVELVMESSSIWKAPFHQIRDELGLEVFLFNPYTTKLIAESKKKTDKVDARILADMLRGGLS